MRAKLNRLVVVDSRGNIYAAAVQDMAVYKYVRKWSAFAEA